MKLSLRALSAVLAVSICSVLHAATFTVTNAGDSGAGSLRQAITDANASASAATVAFSIGSGLQTIRLLSKLPEVAAYVLIDGRTQPGFAGNPLIELDATNVLLSFGEAPITTAGTVRSIIVNRSQQSGVSLGPGAQLYGCWIGLSSSGRSAAPNGIGVRTFTAGTIIGGPGGDGNVISGNTAYGILLGSGASATVAGNRIGTDYTGEQAVPNGNDGIEIEYDTAPITIGGQAGMGNYIAGNNGGPGIDVFYSSNVVISHNSIGVTRSGARLGNRSGVAIYQSSNNSVVDNLIANNDVGVMLTGNSSRDEVRRNSIQNHLYLGISLGYEYNFVFTPLANDAGDADTGPNAKQNYPLISSATSIGGSVTIAGSLNTESNQTYALDFYSSPQCGAQGHGEGASYLGSASVSTDGGGNGTFNVTFARSLAQGSVVTATATSNLNNTSEFSACTTVTGAGVLSFSSASVRVNESASPVSVTIVRTLGTAGSETVNYTTQDGTANGGSDYTATSGSVTFADGESSKTILIPILNDSTPENDETFNVVLTPGSGATLGQPSTMTITVADDDPIHISIADAAVTEGDSGLKTMAFTVSFDHPLNAQCFALVYHTQDGTARASADYLEAVGSIAPQAGTTSVTIPVQVIGNTAVSADRTFTLSIAYSGGSCSNNPLFVRTTAIGTIINDDFGMAAAKVAAGAKTRMSIYLGTVPKAADTVTLTSSNPAVARVPASANVPTVTNSMGFDVDGLTAGSSLVTAQMPPSLGGGKLTAMVEVYQPVSLTFDPATLNLPIGTTVSIHVTMTPAPAAATTLKVSGGSAMAEVPGGVTIAADGHGSFTIKGVAEGTTSIAVTLPEANGGGDVSFPFSVTAAPAGAFLTSIAPATSPAAGGTPVLLTGLNFAPSCTVSFGVTAAAAESYVSPTAILAVSPLHAAGRVDLTVSCGSQQSTLPAAFEYVGAPTPPRQHAARH
jgi:hypothetical protein